MSKRAEPKLVTFTPAETFTGYPDGKTAVLFRAGVESQPVTGAFAQLMRDKGLVVPRTPHTEISNGRTRSIGPGSGAAVEQSSEESVE